MKRKITDLLDEYMGDGIPMDPVPVPDLRRIKEAAMKKTDQGHKPIRPLRIVLIAAAVIVLLTGTALGVIHYAGITDSLENRWETFGSEEMTQAQKDFIEERSISVGDSVTDQDITVTVDSLTCTTDTVYILYTIALDSTVYDIENITSILDWLSPISVENPEYGVIDSVGGGGNGNPAKDGVETWETRIKFEDLPEGANLGDGNTTLHMNITEIVYGKDDGAGMKEADGRIQGDWSFSILLPELEAIETKESDAVVSFDTTLEFENGIVLELCDIKVNESECAFLVRTDSEDYIFVGGDGIQAQLARTAQPDVPTFVMYANMADGSMVYGAAGMDYELGEDVDRWTLQWATPMDPKSIVSLTFSDGTTEIEVPLTN